MTINFTLSMSVAPNGNIRIKTFETTALALADATKDYVAPVANPLVATIDVPNATPHIVNIYDSPGGTDDGTLLSSFLYDPSFNSVSVRDDKYYTVGSGTGNAPNDGDTALVDPDLKGYDYDVEIRGTGTMMTDGSEVSINAAGGFNLTATGDKFYNGQIIIIHFHPQVATYQPQTGGGSAKLINGIILITADTTLGPTHYNQMLNLAATGNSLNITLPALNTVPAATLFPMMANGGNQVNASIIAAGTDKIMWNGAGRQTMYLGKDEQLWLMNSTDYWQVVMSKGNFDKVGLQSWSDIVIPGTITRNGSLLLRATYPRLFNDYILKLPSSNIVSETTWNADDTQKGFCTLGDGSTNFRIMDSRGLFIRALDGSRGIDTGRALSGSYQADAFAQHSHPLARKNAANGADTDQVKDYYSTDGDLGYSLVGGTGGSNRFVTGTTGDTETRGKNEAKIPLIFI